MQTHIYSFYLLFINHTTLVIYILYFDLRKVANLILYFRSFFMLSSNCLFCNIHSSKTASISMQKQQSSESNQPNQLSELAVSLQPSLEEVTDRLQELNKNIQTLPSEAIVHLKEYMTVYVQNHSRSDELFKQLFVIHLFSTICEHNIMAKMFSMAGSSPVTGQRIGSTNSRMKAIGILEIFNLFLANIGNKSEMVYVFSHPLFHQYLLVNYDPLKQPMESIEYYIQLLKTIVLKLEMIGDDSNNTSSLLKLFCNSKYPTFPLLLNCIVLGLKRNMKEELVRITARYCILQILQLIGKGQSKKKLGNCFLTELHMVVLFYEVIQQTIQEELHDQDNTVKYITDLLVTLKDNQKSILMFFTIFANSIVFQYIGGGNPNPAPSIHVLLKLSNSFSEIEELEHFPALYLAPIYEILGRFMFNKYISNISLSSYILLKNSISTKEMNPNIGKLLKFYVEKNSKEMVEKIQNLQINCEFKKEERQSLLAKLYSYNEDNNEFFELKENYLNSKKQSTASWIYNTLVKKINFDYASTDYARKICKLVSANFEATESFGFLDHSSRFSPPTSLYLFELLRSSSKDFYHFGQLSQDTQKFDINFNQTRDLLKMDACLLKTILNTLELVLCQIDSLYPDKTRLETILALEQSYDPKQLSHVGEVYFILHFRRYVSANFSDIFCFSKSQKLPAVIKLLHRVYFQLEPEMNTYDHSHLVTEILKLEKQLRSSIQEKGHQEFFRYIESGVEKKMIEYTEKRMENSMMVFKSEGLAKTNKNQKGGSKAKSKSSFLQSLSLISEPSKSSSGNKGPILTTELFSYKQSSEKMIASKLLHLELLRQIMDRDRNLVKPLSKIVERRFIEKYRREMSQVKNSSQQKGLDKQDTLRVEEVELGFDSNNQKGIIEIVCDWEQCCLLFCLRSNEAKIHLKGRLNEIELKCSSDIPISEKEDDCRLWISGTANSIDFGHKAKAGQFLQEIKKITFDYEELCVLSIEQYFNGKFMDK